MTKWVWSRYDRLAWCFQQKKASQNAAQESVNLKTGVCQCLSQSRFL